MLNYTEVAPKDGLGLALLTADLQVMTDVVVDLAAVLKGAQDFRLFALHKHNQLYIASALVPLVRVALFVLAPLAWPIAKLLDCLLHSDDDESNEAYKRGELSALIRIQYEERLAAKRKRKQERCRNY